jgi:hypothetical protein
MHVFPVQKPSIGLSLTAQAVTSVELFPALWPLQRRRIRALKRHALAAKLVRPSTDGNNISEVPAFAKSLTALTGSRHCAPVAMSLPNQCAHIALLNFDVLPKSPAECAALVRWRLEKDLQIPATECRVAYRIFGIPTGDKFSDCSKHRVLVAAIQNNVLTQYEQACEQAGLLPVEVGIQGLQLFDLGRAMIRQDKEWFFASLLDDQFFFVAVRQACPFLLRSKPLPKTPAHQQLELIASIQYYDELCASMGSKLQSSPRSLYLLGQDLDHPSEPLGATIEADSPATLDMTITDSLRINVCSLKKDFLPISWPTSDIRWTSGLSALASLIHNDA